MLNNTGKCGGNRVSFAWVLVLGLLTMVSAAARAGTLGDDIGIDVRSWALGNAVTADPPGISAVHFNPAGLADLDGRQVDYQGIAAIFGLSSKYSAPAGYNIFGYSDDPVVCTDTPNIHSTCTNFITGSSKAQGVALYIPIADKIVELPPGPLFAPLIAFSIKPPGSKFTFANSFYAPTVAGYYRKDNDPGNFWGKDVAIERFTYLSPSIAFKATDELSLGMSVGLSYQAVALQQDFRSPNEILGVARLINDTICPPFRGNSNFVVDLFLFGFCNAKQGIGPFGSLATLQVSMQQTLSPTYNLGILWKPNEDFAWGAVYQSGSHMKLSGHYQINYAEGVQDVFNSVGGSPTGAILLAILGLPNHVPPVEKGTVSMNLDYPAHFKTGIKYMIFPDLKWTFDIGWSQYSAWKNFTFTFANPPAVLGIAKLLSPNVTPTTLTLPLGFRDVWNWGTGFEYYWNNRLHLRAGFEWRPGALPDQRRTPLLPINNANFYGAGLGYKYDKDTDIDLSMAYLYSHDKIPANTSTNANSTNITNIIYNPYAGLDIKTSASIMLFGIAYRTRW
jgi:long-subunit fatty acid transport protein